MTPFDWYCGGRRIEVLHRPLVLGIINVTPDSFSDGGQFADPAAAVAHARKLIADGADLLDIGGESTRPGATPVDADDELRRVLPVVKALAELGGIPISIDTSKAVVARECLAAGACIINDVTGLRGDPDMPAVVARANAGAIVMHMRGTPATMQVAPHYDDVVREVGEFFAERIATLSDAGIPVRNLAIDPGIGFGKTSVHNLQLLANLDHYRSFGRPIVLGVSRKKVISAVCGRATEDRLAGTLALNCFAMMLGAAHVLRVHDAGPMRDAVDLWTAQHQHRIPSRDSL